MSKNQYRSNYCEEIHTKINQDIKLAGWISKKRDHGNMIFIDLKDHTGIVQCTIDINEPCFQNIDDLSLESVVSIEGKVIQRPSDSFNETLQSGKVEIKINKLEVLSNANILPFSMHQNDIGEELRLKYRFLDLRRQTMQDRLKLRFEVIKMIRSIMEENDFMEVQTPILTSSSPEGARDYVIPSRLNPGKFYALPQAPQQFKQLLMISGVNKYYQIAPCFRDEDTRADRAPGAFYQLDMEIAFTTQDEIFEILENLIFKIFSQFRPDMEISNTPFIRIPYKESMLKYGSDKPDLRINLQYEDITNLFANNCPKIFESVLEKKGKILFLPIKGLSKQTRKFFDEMQKYAQNNGAKGLGYILFEPDKRGPLAKILPDEVCNLVQSKADGAFFVADTEDNLYKYTNLIIKKVAEDMNLINNTKFEFCWITDYPMFEKKDNKWDFSHNPFSMPQGEMDSLQKLDPSEIKAYQYDLVCNGIEITSGAIRNHRTDIMYKAFEIAGYTSEEVDKEFGAMIKAFQYGAPPHGGAAPGIDRILMLLADTENIREVIPFPLNQQGQDLMMDAPSEISDKHLNELNIKLKPC